MTFFAMDPAKFSRVAKSLKSDSHSDSFQMMRLDETNVDDSLNMSMTG